MVSKMTFRENIISCVRSSRINCKCRDITTRVADGHMSNTVTTSYFHIKIAMEKKRWHVTFYFIKNCQDKNKYIYICLLMNSNVWLKWKWDKEIKTHSLQLWHWINCDNFFRLSSAQFPFQYYTHHHQFAFSLTEGLVSQKIEKIERKRKKLDSCLV